MASVSAEVGWVSRHQWNPPPYLFQIAQPGWLNKRSRRNMKEVYERIRNVTEKKRTRLKKAGVLRTFAAFSIKCASSLNHLFTFKRWCRTTQLRQLQKHAKRKSYAPQNSETLRVEVSSARQCSDVDFISAVPRWNNTQIVSEHKNSPSSYWPIFQHMEIGIFQAQYRLGGRAMALGLNGYQV